MNIKITPKKLSGNITAPASKSEAHRILICAALADKASKININSCFPFRGFNATVCVEERRNEPERVTLNDDINATIDCLRALGADVDVKDNIINVTPINKNSIPARPVLDCRESGSTLRFMLPVAAALCDNAVFKGSGRLPERPVNDLLDAMREHGVNFSSDKLPLETHGNLQAGEFSIKGDVSSQYITGLLLALPILNSDSKIILTSPLKSADYVNITLKVMSDFDVNVNFNNNIYEISGYDKFKSPENISVGGDWSGAAFYLAAGALSGDISVSGLDINSAQGDKKILEFLEKFGANVELAENLRPLQGERAMKWRGGANQIQVEMAVGQRGTPLITISPQKLIAQRIDIDATPDLLPILAVVAAFADGTTEFYNGTRLRLKESDRITATAKMINSLGGHAEELTDGLIIHGHGKLTGGTVDGFNDHRIVMAAAIAASRCEHDVIITGAEAVRKSYVNFFEEYNKLGGSAHVVSVRE